MKPFSYERRVGFADTDAMGVVHHAQYLIYMEEARSAWMRARGLSGTHFPATDHVLALLHYQVWHFRSSTFEDLLRVELQARRDGLKIRFQYAIYNGDTRIAEAETVHVPVNKDLKPVRHNRDLMRVMEKEAWIETWLSNS